MDILDVIKPYIPDPADGALPFWLLIVSTAAIGNTISNYISGEAARKVYVGSSAHTDKNPQPQLYVKPSATSAPVPVASSPSSNSPVTPLSSRTFGTWSFLSATVRLYTAYNIRDRIAYELGIWSFVIAAAHFVLEWQVFGSTRWQRGFAAPMFVSSASLAWMLTAWGSYIQ